MKERAVSENLQYKSAALFTRTPLNYPDPPAAVSCVGPGATTSVYRLIRSQPQFLRYKNHLPYDLSLFRVRSLAYVDATRTYTSSYTYNGVRLRTTERFAGNCFRTNLPDVRLPADTYEGMLINNCYSQMKDMKVDLSVTALEIGQTLDLVAGTAKRVSDGVNYIIKKDFGKAARALKMRRPKGASRTKTASDNLLAYQFGVLQLVQDATGSLQAINDLLSSVPLFTVSAKYEVPKSLKSTDVSEYPEVPGLTAVFENRFNGVEKWSVSLMFGFDDAFLRNMSQLGLSNPVNTVFQTRPLSFLAGWFVSVDAVMASFDALHGLEFISGSYSKVVKGYVKTQPLSVTWPYTPGKLNNPPVSGSLSASVGETEIAIQRRVVYPYMPPPEFLFRNPFTRDPAAKMVTTAAIFRQRVDPLIRKGGK